jgi:hypothetical protein
MTEHAVTAPPTTIDEAARRAVMHRVYSLLLRVAAQKRAASQDAAANQTRTVDDGPVEKREQKEY